MTDDPQERASKGGKARAALLSPEDRKKIATAAAEARWGTSLPTALYGSPDKPIRLGPVEIQCYVLDDERRVLVQRGLQSGIGMSTSGGSGGTHRMARFIASLEAKGIETDDLSLRMSNPILFRSSGFGKPGYGYEATILTEICDAVLEARKRGVLLANQEAYADQCEILVRSLAKVGIVALVDEATGYQKAREENALAEILQKFISKELRKWVRRFPFEYYEELFRLKGWDTSDLTPNSPKPVEVGKITDDLVYKRLAPGVRAELKRLTPRNPKGYLVSKLHQHLTDEVGNPKLEKHISNVLMVMKLSDDWQGFMKNVNKVLPQYGKNFELQLND